MQTKETIAKYTVGQCWTSSTEPDLGVGKITGTELRRITVYFETGEETRIYSSQNPPLIRVVYSAGDRISVGGKDVLVRETRERDGLIYYDDGVCQVCESELDSDSVYNRPQDLFGHAGAGGGNNAQFELRSKTYSVLHDYYTSPLRGLLGGRIDLIPHQLYVVDAVVSRRNPRVLLADEIGLGITIEACMILHRKRLQGQAERVLVLVPDALVHQWFVELLRRFNLKAAIFDEERCSAIEKNPEAGNPFLEDQLVLCSISWLVDMPLRALQAVQAGWDMLIVDEAHHLEWREKESSTEYAVVEALAEECRSLLLLTATPEETGDQGHFARLRLLDTDRYNSLDQFRQDNAEYNQLVPVVEALEAGEPLDAQMYALLKARGIEPVDDAKKLLEAIMDCYGPGRVIFRNTRRIIKGFPARFIHPVRLTAEDRTPRRWLVDAIRKLTPAKILVILQFAEDALSLYDFLKAETGIPVGVFHENMTLIQRDRQAAWFADPEGAQVLVASEIGGEGRNFQFAHHLVFMDVPSNPEVVEQRIGRLDRIGQQHAIHIHVPYVAGSRDEKHMLWLHDAIDAFSRPLAGAHEIYALCRNTLEDTAFAVGTDSWSDFINYSRRQSLRITNRVIHGRDRLLQLHSYKADSARHLVDAIAEKDQETQLEQFLLSFFDIYGVYPEVIENRCWVLRYSPVISDIFPAFPRDGMMVTFDRAFALTREEVGFITWDHPLVRGAVDLIRGTTEGTAVEVMWETDSTIRLDSRFLVEFLYILEPLGLTSDAVRYLSMEPLRVVLDEKGHEWHGASLENGVFLDLNVNDPEKNRFMQSFIKSYLNDAEEIVLKSAMKKKRQACAEYAQFVDKEAYREKLLRNRREEDVESGEISSFKVAGNVKEQIESAPVRLDAIRWIWRKTGNP